MLHLLIGGLILPEAHSRKWTSTLPDLSKIFFSKNSLTALNLYPTSSPAFYNLSTSVFWYQIVPYLMMLLGRCLLLLLFLCLVFDRRKLKIKKQNEATLYSCSQVAEKVVRHSELSVYNPPLCYGHPLKSMKLIVIFF